MRTAYFNRSRVGKSVGVTRETENSKYAPLYKLAASEAEKAQVIKSLMTEKKKILSTGNVLMTESDFTPEFCDLIFDDRHRAEMYEA